MGAGTRRQSGAVAQSRAAGSVKGARWDATSRATIDHRRPVNIGRTAYLNATSRATIEHRRPVKSAEIDGTQPLGRSWHRRPVPSNGSLLRVPIMTMGRASVGDVPGDD